MKHLALLTAVAVIALPLTAEAGNYHNKRAQTMDASTRLAVTTPETVRVRPQQFALQGINGSVSIEGQKIYFVEPDGDKYFAPDGPYTTQDGVTYYSDDGVISLIEAPQEVVYVDAAVLDNNRNGYYDDVDVNVETQTRTYNVND